MDGQLSRRQLTHAGVALASTVAMSGKGNARSRPRYSVRFAVKYAMITPTAAPETRFRIAEQAGLDGVEVTTKDQKYAHRIMRASERTGVSVHGVTHGTSDRYDEAIDLCAELGGKSVLVIAKEKSGISYQENYRLAQRFVEAALRRAERKAITLMVENVRASFLKHAEEMARFIDSFKSPWVKAYFDTGNAITWTNQTAEHWAEVLGRRIGKIDVKDRGHAQFGDPKLRRANAVGTDGGEVHWERVRTILQQNRFQGWATAEVKGGDGDRIRGINEWMRSVLREPA